MQSMATNSSHTKKRTRSSMALQVNSMGRVDIQVKMINTRGTRSSVSGLRLVLELRYGRHGTDFNRATTWWRTSCQDSEPHTTHVVKMHRPSTADPKGHGRHTKANMALFITHRPLTVLAAGVTYQHSSNPRLADRVT